MPRTQLAAIPYTIRNGQLLVLMVTSRETRRWIVPKGWQEKKVPDSEQAAREAYEEAGVLGIVSRTPAGRYRYDKRLKDGKLKPVTVEIYPLEVDEILGEWPEKDERERCWMTPSQAAMAVQEGSLAAYLLGLAVNPPSTAGSRPGKRILKETRNSF